MRNWAYHKAGAEAWRKNMEAQGYKVYIKMTCDNRWHVRPIRKQQGVVDAICQYPGGYGFPGKFLYAMH